MALDENIVVQQGNVTSQADEIKNLVANLKSEVEKLKNKVNQFTGTDLMLEWATEKGQEWEAFSHTDMEKVCGDLIAGAESLDKIVAQTEEYQKPE